MTNKKSYLATEVATAIHAINQTLARHNMQPLYGIVLQNREEEKTLRSARDHDTALEITIGGNLTINGARVFTGPEI
jgi:hypothetical protein